MNIKTICNNQQKKKSEIEKIQELSDSVTYQIELTGFEAAALFKICGNVGGSISGIRRITDKIWDTLSCDNKIRPILSYINDNVEVERSLWIQFDNTNPEIR